MGQGYAWLEARAEQEGEATAARVAGYAGLQANLSLVSSEVELLSPEKEHRQTRTLTPTLTPTLSPGKTGAPHSGAAAEAWLWP